MGNEGDFGRASEVVDDETMGIHNRDGFERLRLGRYVLGVWRFSREGVLKKGSIEHNVRLAATAAILRFKIVPSRSSATENDVFVGQKVRKWKVQVVRGLKQVRPG